VAVLVTAAGATPSKKLADARAKFRAGECTSVIALVYPLLFPNPALATEAELSEAYVMLGVCYFETDELDEAEKWFEEALIINPELDLDPEVYSRKVISFFRKLKDAIRDKLEKAEQDRKLAAYKNALASLRQVNVERHPYWMNFIPFGAGQFQNGESGKGKFFAISEAALGGTSLVAFGILSVQYGWPRHDIPRDDVDLAANLQRVQVGTGIAFSIIYIWGVVDALVHYQPTIVRTTQIDPDLLPDDFLPKPEARFRLLPVAGPDEAGLVLRWEF
jgi:tetratricopeptide (TPR) repeat protein